MIDSEILKEKCRVQKKLSEESGSVSAYLDQAHNTVEKITASFGVKFKYAKLSNKVLDDHTGTSPSVH